MTIEDPLKALSELLSPRDLEELKHAVQREVQQNPRIALIGEAGVGKSSTINALFGTKLPVSDVLAGTTTAIATDVSLPTPESPHRTSNDASSAAPEIAPNESATEAIAQATPQHQSENVAGEHLAARAEISAPRGQITVIDMPGLGETEERDQYYLPVYRAVMPTVDVALWILDASRALASTQYYRRRLQEMFNDNVFTRIVFCVNKADTFRPGEWNILANLPGLEQQQSISIHLAWLRKVLQVDESHIVAYSALKRYNLSSLLNAMLEAMPPERRVALNARALLADPIELVDPVLRPLAEQQLNTSR